MAISNGLRCALAINSGDFILICSSEKPAGFSELPFHEMEPGGKMLLSSPGLLREKTIGE